MTIRTEIFQGTFIITCKGSAMDSSLIKEFLTAMGSFLSKTQLDILLDMDDVRQVDSTGLSSIARALNKLDPVGSLILCGVEPRILDLLKMADLDSIFIQKSSRQTALGHLFLQRQESTEQSKTLDASNGMPPAPRKDQDKIATASAKDDSVLLWDVAIEDFEEIEDEEYVAETAKTPQGLKTEAKKTTVPNTERRKYRRISHRQIMNEEFLVYCKNMATGKHHPAIIENISPGGLLMNSRSKLTIGDEFLLEGRIGRNFKFKEHAISRSCRSEGYGLEFINLSTATSHFLATLTGSVDMTQANRFVTDRPN
jgi:anti-anti-sigma factor